jgi:hypothetical protein
MSEPLVNTTKLPSDFIPKLIASAKGNEKLVEQYPLLKDLKEVTLENSVGLRVKLDSPLGEMETVIRLEVNNETG